MAPLNRSTTEADQSELASQRARHPLTVLRHTPSRSAVSPKPKPSPAIKIIRARRAKAGGVDAQRLNRSRAQRSSGLKSIAAARRGMTFSTSQRIRPKKIKGLNFFERTEQTLLRVLQRPEFNIRGLRRADLKPFVPLTQFHIVPTMALAK